jgi:hypothetical protein
MRFQLIRQFAIAPLFAEEPAQSHEPRTQSVHKASSQVALRVIQYLSATIGSSRIARCAEIQQANKPATAYFTE